MLLSIGKAFANHDFGTKWQSIEKGNKENVFKKEACALIGSIEWRRPSCIFARRPSLKVFWKMT
jgi:hypothetical protein